MRAVSNVTTANGRTSTMSMTRFAASLALVFAAMTPLTVRAADNIPAPDMVEPYVKDALPVCEGATFSRTEIQHKLPANLSGSVIKLESPRGICDGQFIHVTSREGESFIGIPWFLDGVEGTTLEEKLTSFGWKNMKEHLTPVIDSTKTRNGLYRVVLSQTTEHGKLPIEGEVDPAGTVFFFGHFHPIKESVSSWRMKTFAPFVENSPAEGAAKPDVTVIEFSDFECPSCQRASGYMTPIIANHGDRVRYVRYDTPLVTNHPWALAAAMAGRAVYRQKPELFWEYKKQVYANQEKLSAFTIDDFARGFAQDHDLDLAKYDADIASPEIKDQILRGLGVAFSNDVRSTPSYMVNGRLVEAGENGKSLAAYIDKLLAK